VAFKDTNGFWTPRAALGQTIFKAAELGAKVLVIDVDINTPVPVICDKGSPADENQIFLEYLKKTADLARENQSILLLPRSETIQGAYGQQLESLISDYRDVIKTGIVSAFKDTSDYQARHLRFYEKRGKRVFFSLQILAPVYFHNTRQAADELLSEKTDEILQGKEEIRIPFPARDVVLFSQADPNAEHLEARYLFRLASRDITGDLCGSVSDPLIKYPELDISPNDLIELDENIFRGQIVIIGTKDREIGDFHATPLGEMSGLYLMVNGINLILEGLQIHQPKWIIRVLIELLVIAVSAILGVYLPPTVSAPVLAGIFFASFSSFSFWLFSKHCMFMDFWLPVAGIELCRLIVDILEFLKSFSKEKECVQ
jgi:CHASE2 domain-containing sensor protein